MPGMPGGRWTAHLPALRRYAAALTGSLPAGDRAIAAALEGIVGRSEAAEPETTDAGLKRMLFTAFHREAELLGQPSVPPEGAPPLSRSLAALPLRECEALLLTAMEGFDAGEAAAILGRLVSVVAADAAAARRRLGQRISSEILIIEDDPVIAMDIAAMVEEMGHLVVGTATRKDEAVAMARATCPGLVLADVRLGDDDGGITAIRELGRSLLAPVVFVTGHPELVMGDRSLDDAFLVTKPIDRDLLRTVIAAALTHP